MPMSESFQMRLTQPQADRLAEVSRVTGLAKSEHIRRAVDYYLAGWRQNAEPTRPDVPARAPATPLVEPTPAPVALAKSEVAAVTTDSARRLPKIARR